MVSEEQVKKILDHKQAQLKDEMKMLERFTKDYKDWVIKSSSYELATFTESEIKDIQGCFNRIHEFQHDIDILTDMLK